MEVTKVDAKISRFHHLPKIGCCCETLIIYSNGWKRTIGSLTLAKYHINNAPSYFVIFKTCQKSLVKQIPATWLIKIWFTHLFLDNRYGAKTWFYERCIKKKIAGNNEGQQTKCIRQTLLAKFKNQFSYDELLKMDNNTSAKALGCSFFYGQKTNLKNLEIA
jgi:hypothetical protein